VDLGVLDLVGGRVTQHHEGVEPRKCFQRLRSADFLRLVDDDDGPVRADDVDGATGLEVIEDVVDATICPCRSR
jgi:hypothetical protein